MLIPKRMTAAFLSLSAAGLIAIAGYEGFSSTAYIPVAGDSPTIGFGSTAGVKMGDKITVAQGLDLLEKDLSTAEEAVRTCVKKPLNQTEFDVYTSLAYNIGGPKFCKSTLVKKLNSEDYAGACAELKKWVHSGGKKLDGLVSRREDEYQRCVAALENGE